MKRFVSCLLVVGLLTVAGCSDKAIYPSDTTKPPPTAPGKDAQMTVPANPGGK